MDVRPDPDFDAERAALPNTAFPRTSTRAWLTADEREIYDAASCQDLAVRIETSVRLKEHRQLDGRARRKAEDKMTPEQEARFTAASKMLDKRQEAHASSTLRTTFHRLARERWDRAGRPEGPPAAESAEVPSVPSYPSLGTVQAAVIEALGEGWRAGYSPENPECIIGFGPENDIARLNPLVEKWKDVRWCLNGLTKEATATLADLPFAEAFAKSFAVCLGTIRIERVLPLEEGAA